MCVCVCPPKDRSKDRSDGRVTTTVEGHPLCHRVAVSPFTVDVSRPVYVRLQIIIILLFAFIGTARGTLAVVFYMPALWMMMVGVVLFAVGSNR